MVHRCLKGDVKFNYVSINNIIALRFDCLCYRHSIILIFGYVFIAICRYISMYSDYFYLQKCAHRKLIYICIFDFKLNIGEKAIIYIYNHYIYMQKYYLPKKMGGIGGEWVE